MRRGDGRRRGTASKRKKKKEKEIVDSETQGKKEKEAHLCPRGVHLDVARAQLVHLLDLEGDAAVLVVDEHRVGEHPVDDFQR